MNETGVKVSASVARALLAFAAETAKPDRSDYRVVGIDGGDLCATDGKTALRFVQPLGPDGGFRASRYHGHCFRRELLDSWFAAVRRKDEDVLELHWQVLSPLPFPPLGKVEPPVGVNEELGVSFDPVFLSRVEVAARACRRFRVKGVDKEAVALPAATLVSLQGPFDPGVFEMNGGPGGHRARVMIMPMRPMYGGGVVPRVGRAKKKTAAAGAKVSR